MGTPTGAIRISRGSLDRLGPLPTVNYPVGSAVTNLLVARDGVLWAGTTAGFFRFNGSAFSLVIPNVDVSRIGEMQDGHLFLITGEALIEWDGAHALRRHQLAREFGGPSETVYHVYQDRSGATWFCTDDGLARVTSGKTDWFKSPDEAGKTKRVFRIHEDESGNIWVATTRGVHRLTGKTFEPLSPITSGRAMFSDADGNLWLGTNGSGLIRLRNRLVRMFTSADGLPNELVMSVLAAHDGTLWVGNDCGGLSWFDGERFHIYDEKNGLKNSCVYSLAEDVNHNLWVGTYGGGLFRFRDGRFTQYSKAQGFPSDVVQDVLAARDGSVWMVTDVGVSRMQNGNLRTYTTADGLSSNAIVNVFQDRSGTIWAGTSQGLDRLDGDRFVSIARQSHKYTGVAGDDASDSVYAFSGRAGLARVAAGVVTELPGLYGEMMLAHGNELWFTGPSGIQRMAADRLRSWDPERDGPLDYASFGRADGMKTAESAAGVPPLTITPDEKLWVATRQGLAMIDLGRMVRTTAKPVTFIGAITVDRRTLPAARELVLPPGPHHVELEFDSIELTSPERTRLQYRLDDVDAAWFDAGPIHAAVYTSIPIGKHQFHVRATNRDGVWDREGIVYWIHQQPHYYETAAFRVALVATGFFLLAGLYQLRLRQAAARLNAQLKGQLAERERIACELHDTLLQGFLSASMHVHIAADNLPVDSQAKPPLTRALQLMGQVIEEGRNAVRGLRSSSSSSPDLEHAFSTIQQELDPQEQVKFRVIVDGQPRPLNTVVRDEMYRIGREALINAFRHARAQRIELELVYSSSQLSILVRDDGCGIDPQILESGRDGHWGLSGMRERANAIGAGLHVWSSATAGTQLELSVPSHVAFQDRRNHTLAWLGKHLQRRSRSQKREAKNGPDK